MRDIRIQRWAHTLIHYCLYLKEGDTLAIASTPLAQLLIEAVYSETLHVGAYPVVLLNLESLDEILVREGNDAQISRLSPATVAALEQADARLNIAAAANPHSLNTIDPAKIALRRSATYSLSRKLREREQAGKFRWCGTLYPTAGYAHDAGMSLEEFEAFVYDVCFLNAPDPIGCWKELGAKQQRLVDWLVGHNNVHILGNGTDLTLSIKDRVFINSDGKRNFPSGEFFTGPVENSANGVIQFDIPSSYGGRSVEGVRLVFKEGKVVEATTRQGQSYLDQMLSLDEGARYLGEFAFGNNSRVNRSTKNVLFDEKMGGTIHLALGASYPETGGLNQSALHWDMVCDLRTSGEVWIDNTLFLKDGQIIV